MIKKFLSCSYIMLSLAASGCAQITDVVNKDKQQPNQHDAFTAARQDCKQQADTFCPLPITKYCTLDVYQKREIFIKNCMFKQGWRDPYNASSYEGPRHFHE